MDHRDWGGKCVDIQLGHRHLVPALNRCTDSRTACPSDASRTAEGCLITFLVIILVLYLVQRLPLDGRTRQIVQIIVIIIGIISLLKYLAVF